MDLNLPSDEQAPRRARTSPARTISLPLLVVITALPAVTINIYLPSMPGIVTYFQTDIPTIQYALSLYLLGLAVGQLAYGPLSDRLGRRPVLLAGMAIYSTGSLLCSLAQGIEIFLVGRVLQAIGGGAGMVLGRAMVRDVYDEARVASVLGYTVMVTTIATAVAPIIGGTLDEAFNWRAPFLFLAGLGAVVVLACIVWAKETRNPSAVPSGKVWMGYARVLKYWAFWRFLLYSSLLTASYFVFIAGSPVVVIELWGYSPTHFGAWWIVGSLSYFIGSYIAGRYSERLGTENMLRLGSPILLLGGAMLMGLLAIGPHHPLSLFAPIGVIFIGSGVVQPNIVSSAINVDPKNIGSASGLLGCTQILFGIMAISLLGLFPTGEPLYFGAICAGALLAGVLAGFVLKR
ncbi:multidrug effflux MFS transporter [Bosea sp. (in: a-proteobacteria)]|uniref:multidrug effflux MFS transporter n=1 Tax=Bosea sp. (in: a-proteobacteria) TaxID=1871050 RepID=UPI00260B434F|nr:multidrug effflux MFS transporter [Bosea sp. (in: a-proteobacteria)]MCO5092181.1 multidrug effflux MFS transporter [Bosea sp. (in: a-proteobacteria)]